MELKMDPALLELAKKTSDNLFKYFSDMTQEKIPVSQIEICQLMGRWVHDRVYAIPKELFGYALDVIHRKSGYQTALNVLSYLEIVLGKRKPAIAIYDHAFHFIGGAQKYGCTIASALQNEFDVTLIANKSVRKEDLQDWYGLDLSLCKLKTCPIPFFEEREKNRSYIEPGAVDLRGDNPFHILSKESGKYDIFINNSMVEMIYPLSLISLFICHFPEREISRFFYVDKYTEIVFNSLYTAHWIKKRWNITPHKHIYPPVDMESSAEPEEKDNIILSASRFDPGGNKLQAEIIKAFVKLSRTYPGSVQGWKLVIVGGSTDENPYLKKVEKLANRYSAFDIELKVNIPVEELKKIYRRSKIFWHLTGLDQKDPAKVEHFGMTIVEAMQNGNIPLVFNGGGQVEIVQEGKTGYLVNATEELIEKTARLIDDPERQKKLSSKAWQDSKKFNKETFIQNVKEYFSGLIERFYPAE